jgi:hypothetical protein
MNPMYKFASIALAAALVGGTAGASLSSWRSQPASADGAQVLGSAQQPAGTGSVTAPITRQLSGSFLQTGQPGEWTTVDATSAAAPAPQGPITAAAATRYASTPATGPAQAKSTTRGSRRVYYDYNEPRARASQPSSYTYTQPPKRTFWDKHRDKLTVAMGAGGGALLGGLMGGKKGAGWGAIAGGAGSAVWTYKMRKKGPESY